MSLNASQILNQSNEFVVIDTNVLALVFSLEECTFLHRLNSWIQQKIKVQADTGIKQLGYREEEDRFYVFKTLRASSNSKIRSWLQELPFFSQSTFTRMTKRLTEIGVLVTGKFNKYAIDKTIWYSIDYDRLNSYVEEQLPIALRKITLTEIKWELDLWFNSSNDDYNSLNHKREIDKLKAAIKINASEELNNQLYKIRDKVSEKKVETTQRCQKMLDTMSFTSYSDVPGAKEIILDLLRSDFFSENKKVSTLPDSPFGQNDKMGYVQNDQIGFCQNEKNYNQNKPEYTTKKNTEDEKEKIKELLDSEIPQVKKILEKAYLEDGIDNLVALTILQDTLYDAMVAFDFSTYKTDLNNRNMSTEVVIPQLYQDCLTFTKENYRGAGNKITGQVNYLSKAIENKVDVLFK